ncbi:MAG: zinc-binding alcohol dehydrogenase [Granulosicoccus sp.]|nr:zinc-binding alcohol dehydrogenase [Granulosicoccus sp.]
MAAPPTLTQRTLWHSKTNSWLTSDDLEFAGASKFSPTSGDRLRVEAIASLISLGTERTVITQTLPTATATQMRIPYMQGDFSEQFTYGYSLVGIVIEGPEQWLQKRVHLLHPHQQFAEVSIHDAHLLPDRLNDDTATLISNMETAVNALWDAQPAIGDCIAVFGYGLIGTLVALLLQRVPGVNVHIVEPDVSRAAAAIKAGFNTSSSVPENKITDITFNTATSDQALQAAIDCTGYEGTIVDLSWHGAELSTLKLGGSFHYDRKRLICSQVSNIPASRARRWDYTRRKDLVIALLLDLQDHLAIDKTISFAEAPEFFNSLRQHSPEERSVVIRYQD